MRQPLRSKRPVKQEILSSDSLPAPTFGWNTKDNQASMDRRYAVYMENWWPTAKTVQIRQGAADFATDVTSGAVKTLLSWNGLTSSKLFACADDGIYDVTAGGVIGAASTACTNGRVEALNFHATGGSFLICVNGTDQLQYYNGTTWTSVANFVIGAGPSTLDTRDICHIHSFKRGLFFLKKSSMSFFYLPIDQITGSVSEYPLGALFDRGGYLVAQGTWTVDGGKGVDDYTCFVSSEGQLALFQGTDPGSSATWALVGVFDIGRPLGPRCFCKFGGDLLYMSYLGCVGLSKFLQSTKVDMSPSITNTIGEAFAEAASLYGDNYGWEFCISPNENILLVNIPVTEYGNSVQYVMNTNTGAWTKFTGWNTFCWALFENTLYAGMAGKVGKFWQPGGDFGGLIQCYVKQANVYLSPRARMKQIRMLQPILKLGGRVAVDAAVDSDFTDNDNYGQAVYSSVANYRFDSALFDQALWGQVAQSRIDWITVADAMGYAKALRLRVLASDATVEWTATNVLFEAGALQG